MPFAFKKCKLFGIKHIILLEGETFLRNKHEIAFFEMKSAHFMVEKKTPLVVVALFNDTVSILVFVCDSYLFCDSCVCELWRVETNNNIIRVVRYEYDEYFKL